MAVEPVAASRPPIQIPEAIGFFLDPPLGACLTCGRVHDQISTCEHHLPVRYRVAYGGRGGTKSWNIARAILLRGTERPMRILCAREFQKSIKQSVHKLLSIQIDKMGLSDFYHVGAQEIKGKNGTEIIFHGLHANVDQIKSLEDIDLCWIEEAATITKDSWEVLVPTIRNEGSEIWISFNPQLPSDHIFKLFCGESPPENAIVRKVSWRDNPFLSSTLRAERDAMFKRDPESEAHIWGGEPWERTDSQVMVRFENGERKTLVHVVEFDTDESWDGPYYGADWGFSPDPTTLLRFWIDETRLMIDYEARGVGWVDTDIDREFRKIPGAAIHRIKADNARPELIAKLRKDKLAPADVVDPSSGEITVKAGDVIEKGLDIVAAKKWTGCVEDGIDFFRSFERIEIHPRCPGIIQDARLWRYKVDQQGNVLPQLVKGNDHGWDGVRYGSEGFIQPRRSWGVVN